MMKGIRVQKMNMYNEEIVRNCNNAFNDLFKIYGALSKDAAKDEKLTLLESMKMYQEISLRVIDASIDSFKK